MKQVFIIPTENRGLGLARVTEALSVLPTDKPWRVEVTEYRDRRSLEQNAYLWGVVYSAILQHSDLQGWDNEDVHEFMLGEHFGWTRLTGFGRTRVKPIKRSSRLTKTEFANYVDFVIRKAADMGVVIPEAA